MNKWKFVKITYWTTASKEEIMKSQVLVKKPSKTVKITDTCVYIQDSFIKTKINFDKLLSYIVFGVWMVAVVYLIIKI